MHKITTFNNISSKGLSRFDANNYDVKPELSNADAILLRSHKLSEAEIESSIKAIARAGAGVNNIPLAACTERGIPVFNTPGANANAVKELVLTGLLLSSRGIVNGINYVNTLDTIDDAKELSKLLEKEKKQFRGQELHGKRLGVIGLGAIGSRVANMALELGMDVLGYDPAISVEAAWRLSSNVQKMDSMQALLAQSDYVTLHLPAIKETHHTINHETIKLFKKGACLLNFAREEVVDSDAALSAIETGQLNMYITDFPTPGLIGKDSVLLMPHIGASTAEAEENCAIMAADQLKDFLENGNIKNSVNFPTLILERSKGYRIGFTNQNVPKVLSNVLAVFAENNINVIDILNKSRNEIAYNLLDVDKPPSKELLNSLRNIEGVITANSF
ncbi:MAG: phosphoglycerate dehydrogenase [Gammaproteobacteria bacterium]|nr:phosphoglycerate dehydrogenase [Gammaproteobacteria bacterium]